MTDTERQNELSRLLGDLKNGDEPLRRYAAEDLGYEGFVEAVPALVHGLMDSSVAVAEACSASLGTIGGDPVARALVVNLASEDVRLRNLSSEVLSKIGNDAVPALASQLESLDRDVRKFAVDSLLTIRSDASMKALVVALDDSDVNVAATAADGLGEIGNQDHLEILATYLGTEDEWMRCAVVRGMTTIGGTKALKLTHSYLNDPSMVVKITCIQGAGKIHELESAVALAELLNSEEPGFFASEVITALHSVVTHLEPEKLSEVPRDGLAEKLGAALDESMKPAMLCAIELSGLFGFTENIPRLLKCLDTEDLDLRAQAVNSLSAIEQTDLVPYQECLQNPECPVASKASMLEAASAVFGEKTKDLFEEALASEDADLVAGALQSVPASLASTFSSLFSDWVRSDSSDLRQVCAEAVGRIGGDEFIVPLVSQLLAETDENVLEAIDSALVQIGSRSTTSGIHAYLRSFSAEERFLGLSRYGIDDLDGQMDDIVASLEDKEPLVRVVSFKVLANLDRLNGDLIKRGLADSDVLVQVEAARGLSQLSDPAACLSIIETQLQAGLQIEERLNVELIGQLVKIGGEVALPLIRPFLHSDSTWVRVEAVDGLKALGDPSVVAELKELVRGAEDEFLDALEQAIYELE